MSHSLKNLGLTLFLMVAAVSSNYGQVQPTRTPEPLPQSYHGDTILQLNPPTDPGGQCLEPFSSGTGFKGTPQWVHQVVDLSAFAHKMVAIRFFFDTRDPLFNKFEGWYLDNIKVGPRIPSPGQSDLFSDDVEGGTQNWITDGNQGTAPGWHIATRRSLSGTHSWWFGNENTGTYQPTSADCNDARSFGSLTSPVIELGDNPKLEFDTFWEIESVNPSSFDVMQIDVETADCHIDTSTINTFQHQGNDPPQPSYGPVTQNCTTANTGCALMSYSNMLLSFDGAYSVERAPKLDTDITNIHGYSDCSILSGVLPQVAAVQGSGTHQVQGVRHDPDLDTFIYRHFCQNNERIVLHLNEIENGVIVAPHFVFVTGANGTDWDLFDPGWRNANPAAALSSLDGHYTGFTPIARVPRSFTVDQARSFEATQSTNSPSVSVSAFSPIELILTDNLGRRLGRSALTGEHFEEIPKGNYYRDFPLALDDSSGVAPGEATGIKTAYIPSPQEGIYQLQATGTALGTFTLRFRSVASDGSAQEITKIGVVDAGTIVIYQLPVSSAPSSPLVVSRAITFQSTLADIANSFKAGLLTRDIANELTEKIQHVLEKTNRGEKHNVSQVLQELAKKIINQTPKKVSPLASQILQEDISVLLGQNSQ